MTRTAEGFFERLGFERTGTLESIPEAVRATLGNACSERSVGFRWPPADTGGPAD